MRRRVQERAEAAPKPKPKTVSFAEESFDPGLPVNAIVHGNALDVLRKLPGESIDMCLTSPPYWGLRTYGTEPQVWGGDAGCEHDWKLRRHWKSDAAIAQGPSSTIPESHSESTDSIEGFCMKCNAWRGELGCEPYFYMYVNHLCMVFDEVGRVLKPSGTLWVNLGDTYNHKPAGEGIEREITAVTNVPEKSLCQIPNRFAIAMTERGWFLRNEIIWWKPNCLPASVTDRFTVDFEKIFFFAKNKKYYFERQYDPYGEDKRMAGIRRAREYGYGGKGSYQEWYRNGRKKQSGHDHSADLEKGFGQHTRGQAQRKPNLMHPLGRNRRCVWRIATKPFAGAHFAVYPPELVETPIRAGCPEGGIILDPFMGSGTTALVALQLNRQFIGIELNPEYIKIAMKRMEIVQQEKLD